MINFNAGPAHLPSSVIEEAREALLDFRGTGIGILETPHRGNHFLEMMHEASVWLRELCGLSENYRVLFLSGGASTQFWQVPANLLPEGGSAAYADTGHWAAQAIREASLYGEVKVICSSKNDNYTCIPALPEIPADTAYFHITTNNTIYGTQWKELPESNIPLIADMSSDILSRPCAMNRASLIYAGAQKNLGAAGVTILIMHEELPGIAPRKLPSMADYRLQLAKDSVYNTPPVFAIYVSWLMLKWMRSRGMENIWGENKRKADQLYHFLDQSKLFVPVVRKDSRSEMNVCFRLAKPDLENALAGFCAEQGISGIKGHRSVGGFRISLYNAIPETQVHTLLEVLSHFEKNNV